MTDIIVMLVMLVASGVITIVIGLIGTIASLFNKGEGYNPPPAKPEVKIDVHVDVPAQTQYPGIAEQFDGRLTNVVRNPWEGIL